MTDKIEQVFEDMICPMCYRLNPQHESMDNGEGCHSCEDREYWCKEFNQPVNNSTSEDLLLTDDGIRLVDPEECACTIENCRNIAKAQLAHCEPLIREKVLKEVGEWLENHAGYIFKDSKEDFGKRRAIFQTDINQLKQGKDLPIL